MHYHKNTNVEKENKGLTLYYNNNNNNNNGNNQQIMNIPGFGNKAFTSEEAKRIQEVLNTDIKPDLLLTRPVPGGDLVSYLHGDESIKIANELFGSDGWSFKIIGMLQELDTANGANYLLFTAHVRIMLMDGSFKENVGCCSTKNIKEISNAKKSAITDALKRCLKLFGPAFGNNLSNISYNKSITAQSQALKRQKQLEDSERSKRAYQLHSENYKLQQLQIQQQQQSQQQSQQQQQLTPSPPRQQQQQQLTPSPPHQQTTTTTVYNNITNIKIENIQSNNNNNNNSVGSSPPEATVPYNNSNNNNHNHVNSNNNNSNSNSLNKNGVVNNHHHHHNQQPQQPPQQKSPNSYHPYPRPPIGGNIKTSPPKSSSTPIPFPLINQKQQQFQQQPQHPQPQQQQQQQELIEEQEEIFSLEDSYVNVVGTY